MVKCFENSGDKMTKIILKPCPFCGADDPDWCDEYDTHGRLSFFIQCRHCDSATGRHYGTKGEAESFWNRRVTPEVLKAHDRENQK